MNNYYLMHYGIKGMRWGVRRSKAELGYYKGRVKISRIHGHKSNPRDSKPNSVSDHISNDGKVSVRTFYDKNGHKYKEIHLTNHGNSKTHNFGKNGEHVVLYSWNIDGSLKHKEHRELTESERKENSDIL